MEKDEWDDTGLEEVWKFNLNAPRSHTLIVNKLINDARLSCKAKGIFLQLMLLKENNERPSTTVLSTKSTDGLVSIRGGLKELEKGGYLTRKNTRNKENTLIDGVEFIISEIPLGTGSLGTGSLRPENPVPYKENKKREINNNTNYSFSKEKEHSETECLHTSPRPTPVIRRDLGQRIGDKLTLRHRPPVIILTEDEKKIVHLWNILSHTPHHREGTQVYKESVKAVRSALTHFSAIEISKAIIHYNALLSHPQTILKTSAPGHRVSLEEFFKFGRFTEERMGRCRVNLGIKSWMEEMRRLLADPAGEKNFGKWALLSVPVKHPRLFGYLKSEFQKRFLGSTAPAWGYEENERFAKSSDMLVDFLEKNKSNFVIPIDLYELADELLKGLENAFGRSGILPGHLCSRNTFHTVLPEHLVKTGNIASGEEVVV